MYKDQEVIDNLEGHIDRVHEVNPPDAEDIVTVESQENVSMEVVIDTLEPPANEEEVRVDVPKKETCYCKSY